MSKHNAQPTPSLSSTQEADLPMMELLSLNDKEPSVSQTQNQQIINKNYKKRLIDKEKRHLTNGNERVRVNNRKKIDYLERRVAQLEKQLTSTKRKFECCPNCRHNLTERVIDNQIMMKQQQYFNNIAGSIDTKRCSKDSLQFQKIDFTNPISFNPEMEEKSWILLGTLMIVMGSKNLDVDGTVNIFKIVKQAVDLVRRQVQKSQPKINLDFYHLKSDIQQTEWMPGLNFDPFYTKQQPSSSLELDGVRVQSVHEYDLFYDRKISFSVKYEALITAMEYMKDYCWFN